MIRQAINLVALDKAIADNIEDTDSAVRKALDAALPQAIAYDTDGVPYLIGE